jgi:GNAT superfamily N-acetyltransferase
MDSKSSAATVRDMAAAGSSLPTSSCLQTARLKDGTLITIRAIRPTDLSSLRSAFNRMSPETRYLRFHAHLTDLPLASWIYLTNVDGRDHVALVARAGDRIVGVARFIRLGDRSERAEVAFVVVDDFQHRGLGRALRDALLTQARIRGVRFLHASVLSDNVGIRRLLAGPRLSLVSDNGDQLIVRVTDELQRGVLLPFR